jgi:PIN domain nuclease of toxin-antitoxin system
MNYLIDTHCILWSISNPEKLSKNVQRILEDPNNKIFVTSLSLWEIALKVRIKKLSISGFKLEEIPSLLKQMSIDLLDLSGDDAINFSGFTLTGHKDPFDLFLVYLAVRNKFILVSKDANISNLKINGLKTIW